MSKVDWSLAPEGATHWNRVNEFFYRFGFARCEYWSEHHKYYKPCSNLDYYAGEMIERPKQPQAWSGPEDGLPPVGMRVTVHGCFHEYTKRFNGQTVRIVVHDQGEYAVFETDDNEYHALVAEKFRLPKTPEQIAHDQRESAIRDIMDIAQVDCRVTAARLVDAGFKREGV